MPLLPMPRMLRAAVVGLCCTACGALRVVPPAGPAGCRVGPPLLSAAHATPLQLAAAAPAAARARLMAPRMQGTDFYDEYVETDPVTGESKTLQLDEKEKLYLECLDAYYNEGGKQLLGDEEYEQLKLDMDFEGSKVATYSKDEIRFVLANKRFKMGTPTMDDAAYDTLRAKLKEQGSLVVMHDSASCSLDTGVCKTDLRIDTGKTRLLYLPGTAGGLLLIMEVIFWTLGIDPIFSVILGSVPAYFFGVWFTENVFAQKPLVTQATCPDCPQVIPVFFGDLFAVQTDGIVPPKGPPKDTIELKCPQCKVELEANRNTMVMATKPKVAK
jgi:hypothetical protein